MTRALPIAMVLLLALTACGGSEPAPVDPAAAERNAELLASAETDPSIVLFTVVPSNANRYSPDELTAEAGLLDLVMDNQTLLPHNVVFEGVDDEARVVSAPGNGVFSGQIVLGPGEHVFYCDIPGHRAQGMEGVLTVR